MRTLVSAALVLAATSCLRQNPSYDRPAGAGSDTGSGAGSGAGSSSGAATSPTGTSAASTGSSGQPETGTSGGSSGDGGSTGGMIYPVASCAELKAFLETQAVVPESGVYNLDVGGPVEVYCDMVLDGGGWTLVGRSAGTEQKTGFGWRSHRGALDDDTAPYSLDLTQHPVGFTEIILGDRVGGKAWGEHVYFFSVPADFVEANQNSLLPVDFKGAIVGDCTPMGIKMFSFGGNTSADQAFFFRDLPLIDPAYYGLLSNGFFLFDLNTTCEQMGLLHRKHGMLMVR